MRLDATNAPMATPKRTGIPKRHRNSCQPRTGQMATVRTGDQVPCSSTGSTGPRHASRRETCERRQTTCLKPSYTRTSGPCASRGIRTAGPPAGQVGHIKTDVRGHKRSEHQVFGLEMGAGLLATGRPRMTWMCLTPTREPAGAHDATAKVIGTALLTPASAKRAGDYYLETGVRLDPVARAAPNLLESDARPSRPPAGGVILALWGALASS